MTLTFFAWCLFMQSFSPEAIEHAQAGSAAREQGRIEVAIQEFRKVAELQPDSAVAHADLGDAYFQHGDYAAATPELEAALRINPDLMLTHQTLGVVLLMQGDPEGALPHLEKMHTPELLGLAYLETGQLDGAIIALHTASAKQPDDLNLLYYLGRALALASKRTFDQAAKINPDLAHKAGLAAGDAGRPRNVYDLQNALAKQPNDVNVLLEFSRAASMSSKEAFDKILQADANSARAHQVRAERYVETGRLREAEREYAESLSLKPNTPHLHRALGDVLAADHNRAAAVTQYRMETELQPFSGDAFYSLGAALLQLGQAKPAAEELAKADRLRPNAPHILLALGGAAFDIHDDARAESSWTKLLSIDKEDNLAARAHLGLSRLYRRAGRSLDADREQAAYERMTTPGGSVK